jgi:hypothetical protein
VKARPPRLAGANVTIFGAEGWDECLNGRAHGLRPVVAYLCAAHCIYASSGLHPTSMALGRCHPICSLLFLLFLFGAVFPDIAANKQPSRTSRTVRTAEELQRATEEGVKLIIITDHLNLRLLSPVRNRNLSTGLLRVSSTVAIQVCWQAHPSLMCMLGLSGAFVRVTSGDN